MAGPRAADVLGRVTLVVGKEEFLNDRIVTQVREAVRGHDPEAEFSSTTASGMEAADLGDLAAPSLFSAIRCVVVTDLASVNADAADGLIEYAAAPADDVALVLVHDGGQRGSGVLTKLRKLPTVTEVKPVGLKPSELPGFVAAEIRSRGASIDQAASEALISAVGQDLRSLAAAARQLASDCAGQKVTVELVGRYFEGRAEAKSFAVADHAFSGRRAAALEELRWALEAGTAAVLVTSAFAGSVRGLARLKGAPRGARDADLARDVGVPPWKLRTLRDQVRGWSPEDLAAAVRAVATADADIKGAASDPAYTLERLVLTITDLHG
ncbi:DNA polymerase III subunit delta [Nocardioides limicola]|uniref:DNA polymerase III subunit delta n=1 Tax=Nocardioides limicola TaxID=2803368 RepID=UPI00193B5D2D|nr:DNA polymerase III subunit delta [Nocardioides sp. DJM-14]